MTIATSFALLFRPYHCLNIATLSKVPSNMQNMSSTTLKHLPNSRIPNYKMIFRKEEIKENKWEEKRCLGVKRGWREWVQAMFPERFNQVDAIFPLVNLSMPFFTEKKRHGIVVRAFSWTDGCMNTFMSCRWGWMLYSNNNSPIHGSANRIPTPPQRGYIYALNIG